MPNSARSLRLSLVLLCILGCGEPEVRDTETVSAPSAPGAASPADPPIPADFAQTENKLVRIGDWLLGQIEVDGEFSDLRVKQLVVDAEGSGLPGVTLISAASARMVDGDVKFNTLSYRLKPDGTVIDVVSRNRGRKIHNNPARIAELERSVADLAEFTLDVPTAVQRARDAVRKSASLASGEALHLVSVEYDYFRRPQELTIELRGEPSGAIHTVAFDAGGKQR